MTISFGFGMSFASAHLCGRCKFVIEPKHIKAGVLTLGSIIVAFAVNGETFVTSFIAILLGAGLIFASQTLWP